MPKHAPSFKHLIATSSKRDDKSSRERSVNERLAASRLSALSLGAGGGGNRSRTEQNGGVERRQAPPHLRHGEEVGARSAGSAAGSSTSTSASELPLTPNSTAVAPAEDRAWSVSWESAGNVLDLDEGLIHPAELLRRSQIAHRAASRSVAGPAPPPSWRSTTSSISSFRSRPHLLKDPSGGNTADVLHESPVTSLQLRQARELLCQAGVASETPMQGSQRLTVVCQHLILRLLHDQTPIDPHDAVHEPAFEGNERGTVAEAPSQGLSYGVTMAQAVLEQLPYFEPQVKLALLDLSASLPQDDQLRLTDACTRALLSDPPAFDPTSGNTATPDDWDNTDYPTPETLPLVSRPEIRHLHLTLAPSSTLLNLLRDIHRAPSIFRSVSLVSLNLAYSCVRDLERLVDILPPGLRELGLVGVRVGTDRGTGFERRSGGVDGDESVKRGLGALGRKMLVLKTLDLRQMQPSPTLEGVAALLIPAAAKAPSLRLLGLYHSLEQKAGKRQCAETAKDDTYDRAIKTLVRDPQRRLHLEVR